MFSEAFEGIMEIQQQRGQCWLKIQGFLIPQWLIIGWSLWICESQEQNLGD